MNYPIEIRERPATIVVPCPKAGCGHAVRYAIKLRRVTCPACGWGVVLAPTEARDFAWMLLGVDPTGAQFLAVIAARCCDVADKPAPLYHRNGKWYAPPRGQETVLETLARLADQAVTNNVTLYKQNGILYATSQQPGHDPYILSRRDGRFACTCQAGQGGKLCAHIAAYYASLQEQAQAATLNVRAALVTQFTPREDAAATRETDEAIYARALAARNELFGND